LRALQFVIAMAVGALLYQGAAVVYRSEMLELKTVEVTGNDGGSVTTQELIDRAGIRRGQSLLEISTGEVVGRLSSHPWIAEARAERILPSKVRIEVVERRPAMVAITGSGPYVVDRTGVVLEQGTEALVKVVDLPAKTKLSPGMRIAAPEFIHALSIFNALPPEIRWSVRTIRAASIDGIAIETSDGVSIFYGAAEKLEEKNYAAQSLLATPAVTGSKPHVIDVRVPSRPAVRSA
jgi:cell division protein FtsQ